MLLVVVSMGGWSLFGFDQLSTLCATKHTHKDTDCSQQDNNSLNSPVHRADALEDLLVARRQAAPWEKDGLPLPDPVGVDVVVDALDLLHCEACVKRGKVLVSSGRARDRSGCA